MKVSHSFRASVLKMLGEVNQKEVDMTVLPDEFKRLKRKANIAHLAAKNDIFLRKFLRNLTKKSVGKVLLNNIKDV